MSDTPYSKEITTYEDSQLVSEIAKLEDENRRLKMVMDINNGMMARCKAEQDRRALAAYWKAHPDLTPLAVGDKLLVTEEFLNSEHVQSFKHVWSRFKVVAVHDLQLWADVARVKNITDGSFSVGVDRVIVSNMRRAYLEREVAHENTD